MAGLTQAQASAALTRWIAADTAVANGQSYSIAGRSLTRANAKEIRENIEYWDGKVREISDSATGTIISQIAPKDD